MPNRIKPRRSYTANSVPLTTDLETNELAINWADGKAFTKNASGQIVSITLGGGGGSSSSEDTALRAYFLPTAPTNVTATAGNGQVSVTWTASTTIAQIPVTDYVVQYSSNSGSTWTTFSDGTATSTSATVTGLTNGTSYVFRVAGTNGVGTGAYSTASSAATPQAGDPLFSSVALLLHMDGSGSTFADSSAYGRTVTPNGGATQSTAQSKFGGKSAYFDGNSYLDAPAAAAPGGSGDFVIEGWIYPTATTGQDRCIFETRGGSGFVVFINPSGALQIYDNTALLLNASSSTLTANQWQHIAIAKSGSTIRYYISGSAAGTITQSSLSAASACRIGSRNDAQASFSGYIDDLRITLNSNRGYTGSTIPVPEAAFPDN